jgi:hypothetical protein
MDTDIAYSPAVLAVTASAVTIASALAAALLHVRVRARTRHDVP